MSNKKLEYTIHILKGVTIITSKVGLVTRNGPLIAAENGTSCFVDVRNLESGGGYRLEYLPGGGVLHHSLQQ